MECDTENDNSLCVNFVDDKDDLHTTPKDFKEFLNNNLGSLITDPFDRCVMFNPVIASDGFPYESINLQQFFKVSVQSPMTRESLLNNSIRISLIKDFIKLSDKYKLSVSKNKFITDNTFENNIEIIREMMDKHNFDMIKEFNNFKLDCIFFSDYSLCEYILQHRVNDYEEEIYNNYIRYIIDHCENLNVTFHCDTSNIFHIFARYCRHNYLITYVLEKLHKQGVNINDLNVPDCNDTTPLEHLIQNYNHQNKMFEYVIDLVTKYNIDLSNRLSKYVIVAIEQHNDSVYKLIDKLDNVNLFVNDLSPLFAAIKYRNISVVEYLLEKSDIYLKNTDGSNAVHFACQYGDFDIAKLLIDKCNDLEIEAIDGWRTIHVACYYNKAKIIQYLLGKGVKIGIPIQKFNDDVTKKYLPINLVELNQKISAQELDILVESMIQLMSVELGM
jgi:hypothetical protein